uniref:Regulatory protein E2 n=1 Tax=Human papillomavirus 7 TaxID=10620 RepID=A0A5B9GD30_HPV07|nr:E2 [Human papillomavirus type 7]QEE83797.1 E2 [Human papillomavirus type 7]QEE83811.1 E2 [Human papillomavirus type 7]
MEKLARRLDLCQEQLLELYEQDSKQLQHHILHWKYIRYESVIYYTARQMGIKRLGHQVVPSLDVSKAKAHAAIEMQMCLESLQTTEYNLEPWTLQDTSQELWLAEPKKCFKKGGKTVEVRFDCNEHNAMHYTLWTAVYVQVEDTWTKVEGQVDHRGLFYTVHGCTTYYVDFGKEAHTYGKTNDWTVIVGSRVICSPSTVEGLPIVAPVDIRHPAATDATDATKVHDAPYALPASTTKVYNDSHAPPRKRRRDGNLSISAVDGCSGRKYVDTGNRARSPDIESNNKIRNSGGGHSTPIIQLEGDANCLKCFRYRLTKVSHLYTNSSTTWRWTTESRTNKNAIITLTYSSVHQRSQFLALVKIPKTIKHSLGMLTIM